MATIAIVVTPPSYLRFSGQLCRSQSARSLRCFARADDDKATPPLLKFAVGGATTFLSLFTSKKSRDDSRDEVIVAGSVEDVVGILQLDYERAYFLTGNFTPDIYTEDCLFEDPTISFRGKDKYSRNLELLIPFFDSPSLKLEKIEKGCTNEMNFVTATWKLRTYLKFPWKPLISIRGSTVYDLDEQFKIVRHSESWDTSALQAVGQIFTFGSVTSVAADE